MHIQDRVRGRQAGSGGLDQHPYFQDHPHCILLCSYKPKCPLAQGLEGSPF